MNKLDLYQYVTLVLEKLGYADHQCVWTRQDGTRLKNQYVTINLSSRGRRVGRDEKSFTSDNRFKLKGHRESTLSINFYGDNAGDRCEEFSDATMWPSVREFAQSKGFCVYERGAPRDLKRVLESSWVDRYQLDLELRSTRVSYDTSVEYINDVDFENNLKINS